MKAAQANKSALAYIAHAYTVEGVREFSQANIARVCRLHVSCVAYAVHVLSVCNALQGTSGDSFIMTDYINAPLQKSFAELSSAFMK